MLSFKNDVTFIISFFNLMVYVLTTGPTVQNKWPVNEIDFGQISAVALDSHGNVLVFHRGSRVWDSSSFNEKNVFQQRGSGPIIEDTVVVLDPFTGSVIFKWGGSRFYMPHGLTIDHDDNVWITDVALHQVFKLPPLTKATARQGLLKSLLILGTPFKPGDDDKHYCKPADVAVMSTGDFFVADGYCNSRIIKYNEKGVKLLEWGRSTVQGQPIQPYSLNVPHSLTLAEEKQMLFVADRENGRIISFNCHSGEFVFDLYSPQHLGSSVFAVSYTAIEGGLLYAVNGPSYIPTQVPIPVQGVVFNVTTKTPVFVFYPPGYFHNPHDVIVSSNGRVSYVVELQPHKIWQFRDSPTEPVLNITTLPNTTEASSVRQTFISEVSHTSHSLPGTWSAYILVTIVVFGAFVLVFFMLKARTGRTRHYESRGLIQDYDDEEGTGLT